MGWFAQIHFRGGEGLREMPLIIVVKPRDFVDVFNDSRLDTRRYTSDPYLTSLRLVMDMCCPIIGCSRHQHQPSKSSCES
jgi:hypothetical protein